MDFCLEDSLYSILRTDRKCISQSSVSWVNLLLLNWHVNPKQCNGSKPIVQNQGSYTSDNTDQDRKKFIMFLPLIRHNSIVPVMHRSVSFSAEDISRHTLRHCPQTNIPVRFFANYSVLRIKWWAAGWSIPYWISSPRDCSSLQNRTRNGRKIPANEGAIQNWKELWPRSLAFRAAVDCPRIPTCVILGVLLPDATRCRLDYGLQGKL